MVQDQRATPEMKNSPWMKLSIWISQYQYGSEPTTMETLLSTSGAMHY